MNNRHILAAILATLLVAVLAGWRLSQPRSSADEAAVRTAETPPPAEADAPPATPAGEVNEWAGANLVEAVLRSEFMQDAARDYLAYMQAALDVENDQVLDFYGKVVDLVGTPVAGADIEGHVFTYGGLDQGRHELRVTTTDQAGNFQLLGVRGARLSLQVKKEGYRHNLSAPYDRPRGHEPSPDQRVVFTLWKQQGADPMLQNSRQVMLDGDGSPVRVSLTAGVRGAPVGDLIVTFSRSPRDIVRGRPFDWTLTLGVPEGGGLVPIRDTYPYLAPTSGYRSTVMVVMPADAEAWKPAFSELYYYRAPGGAYYGWIKVSLQADFQPGPTQFRVEAYLNPSGSTNLEYDPAHKFQALR